MSKIKSYELWLPCFKQGDDLASAQERAQENECENQTESASLLHAQALEDAATTLKVMAKYAKESGLKIEHADTHHISVTIDELIGEQLIKDGYLTKLRFKDELVRHKILDLIGDLSLMGAEIKAHIFGIRSGHDLNIKLSKKLEEVG